MKSLAISKEYGLARYVAHQAYYSLIGRDYEWELMPLALDQGVGCVAWSPLGFARLTGKIRRGQPLPETSRLRHSDATAGGPTVPDEYLFRVVDALDAIAEETGKTVPQVAINWVLRRPSVSTCDHRRPRRGAAPPEPGRDRLGADARADRPARRRQRDGPVVSDLAPAALRRAEPAGGVMAAVGVRAEKHMPDRVRQPQPALCEPRLWDRLAEVRFALVRSPSTTGLGKAWVSYVESQSIQGIGGA